MFTRTALPRLGKPPLSLHCPARRPRRRKIGRIELGACQQTASARNEQLAHIKTVAVSLEQLLACT